MKKEIPIFFATDNNYAHCLAAAMKSLLENASKEYFYRIYVLTTELKQDYREKISKIVLDYPENASVEYKSLREEMENSPGTFHLRDYYTRETYCRIFIPRLFPQYEKVIYLDCDIILLGDISEFYNTDISGYLMGAAHEDVADVLPNFQEYIDKNLGVDHKTYFSAGVLLINAQMYRKLDIESKFINLMNNYTFRITQDEDYLNVLSYGKTLLLDQGWNKAPFKMDSFDEKNLKLIHYKINWKPWHFDDTLWGEYFWKYSSQTEFYEESKSIFAAYTDEMRKKDDEDFKVLLQHIDEDVLDPFSYAKTKGKAPDRVKVLKKIAQYEKEGKFSVDVEDDPPDIPLLPEQVDYMNKKLSSRILMKFANCVGRIFINKLIKDKLLVIKEVRGIENYVGLKHEGAILTCNHFNAFDNFAIYKAIENHVYHRELIKVIREGNFTNFPGLYGFLFRHCNTLPLSQNISTMKKFMEAVKSYLFQGRHILVYAEQAMWWNYRKPRPLTNGAFKFAADNNVPVIPFFITMSDSDRIGGDGFPIQEYTIHILEPIFPDPEKSIRQNAEYMKNRNFEAWKKVYEETYGIPLEYTTVEAE